jgi:hypothetical protein
LIETENIIDYEIDYSNEKIHLYTLNGVYELIEPSFAYSKYYTNIKK